MGATATIPRGKAAPAKATATPPFPPELHDVAIESIDVGTNVRNGAGDVAELADSIRSVGVLEPIRVAEVGAGRYELVYGQRRLVAAKAAGLTTIPAIVNAGAEVEQSRTIRQLIENLQREDLNPLEEARAYRSLMDADPTLTQAELAKRIGKAAPTISNSLRLLKLPATVQKRVADGSLSASHAKAIATLPDSEAVKVAERVAKGKISSHQVEQEIAAAQERQSQTDRDRDALKSVLPIVQQLLADKGLAKDAVSLAPTSDVLREALLADGWAIVDRPNGAAYVHGQKDDCTVYQVNWHPNWGTSYKPDVTQLCVDAGHRKAREERDRKQREANDRKWERERAKGAEAVREQRKSLRGELAGYSAIIAADPARMARISLFLALQGGRGATVDWFVEAVLGTDDPSVVEETPLWEHVAALSDHEVASWRARLLAEVLLSWPEDDQLRQSLLAHADEPAAKPKAKAKAAKA